MKNLTPTNKLIVMAVFIVLSILSLAPAPGYAHGRIDHLVSVGGPVGIAGSPVDSLHP